MRVVFFGSPDFAVPSLAALLGEGFDVLAAVTQPDRPQGRSWSDLVPPPVKLAAEEEGVAVLQPERPTDPAFLEALRELAPDIGVVVAYGHILKPELLQLPKLGMVNLHPSLLPKLRGPAPIPWAIINGFDQTGVTIMRMEAGLDSGPILHQIAEPLPPDITAGELSAHLSEVGAEALVEALALLSQGAIEARPQVDAQATYAPKLTRETARVDWGIEPARIARLIRGLDPRPGAWSDLDGQPVKLFGAAVVPTPGGGGTPGEILPADGQLIVAAGSALERGAVLIEEVQPAGKARMGSADWLRGRGAEAGQRLR